eukprot:TRINITY_DN1527_c0_g1_i3.p1 TRINITY_DN1527_c0_g1~~TRINITY_DN1527_c0_g1_i3.p1  ORF type:complete len:384 (+),score=42.20 TRINITY_DN1527_c0_g1_i3:159-1310(+)
MSSGWVSTLKSREEFNYNYVYLETLGSGSYGIVSGHSKRNEEGSKYAVKVIRSRPLDENWNTTLKAEVLYMREWMNIRHPHLVRIIDVFQIDHSELAIQMEHCNLGTLTRYISRSGGFLHLDRGFHIICHIIDGYRELHKRGIIHRNIKDENVLLKGTDWKIGDYGFSKEFHHKAMELTSQVGTLLAQAPQYFQRNTYTNKCDMWSMGILFYKMLYGHYPFSGKNIIELSRYIQNWRGQLTDTPGIPPKIREFIERCLAYNESDRMSWEEFFNFPVDHLPASLKRDMGLEKAVYLLNITNERADRIRELLKTIIPVLRKKKIEWESFLMDVNAVLYRSFRKVENKLKEFSRSELPDERDQLAADLSKLKQFMNQDYNLSLIHI